MNNEALRIENLHLSYKGLAGTTFSKPSALAYFDKSSDMDKELICGANLVLNRGETLCIGGPSGQGKSALLRVIAGLARPSEGRLYYFGEHIPAERQTALEIAKRQVGLVFQNGALISNLRVRDNIALPLRYHKKGSPKEIEDKINMAMDLMRVRDCATMFPHQLSVGMQKRVAIARSWAMRILFKTSIIIITHDLMIAKELNCNLVFLYNKTLTEPHSFDYWQTADNAISRELFRDLRTSG